MIEPAQLSFDPNGLPRSTAFDDIYHSAAGGIAQAYAVFLQGNGLPERWRRRHAFTILETGFGLGLNFLATWQAWRNDPESSPRLDFLSVDKHPCTVAQLAAAHRALPEDLADAARQLRDQWPPLAAGFHRLEFRDGPRTLALTLAFGDATACVPQFVAAPDAVYLDGFSPSKNPTLWSPPLMREIALLAAVGCTVATWSVAANVRATLDAAGFAVDRHPGFGAKRQRLAGRLRGTDAPHERPNADRRRAIIIGAGLAGCMAAERLATHGWNVTLLERRAAPALETSGNLAAALLPVLSLDDNRLSRLNRAAYFYALRRYRQWQVQGREIRWAACGVLQMPRSDEHAVKQQEILSRNGFPTDFARWVDGEEARDLSGASVAEGGWWFPGGGWVHPPAVCRAALDAADSRLSVRFNTTVTRLERPGEHWQAFDSEGTLIDEAATVILAGALDITTLAPAAHLPIFRFRGQVTHFPPSAMTTGLRVVLCREGYLTPALDGLHCVGASFQRSADAELREEDHAANLDRLDRILPGARDSLARSPLSGRVGFRPVSPDKMPIVGPVYQPDTLPQGRDLSGIERWPGLYALTGYGARGAVWAPLMAELLASELSGTPLPVEAELAAHVDPARFLARQVRTRQFAL